MRYFLILTFVMVGCISLSSQAFADQDRQARIRAAIEHERVMPVSETLDAMIDEMKKNPQLGSLNEADYKALRESYDLEALRKVTIESMADNFTLEEIEALTAFYSTPEGRSVMEKMPDYMTDIMPFIQKQSMASLQYVMQSKAKRDAESEK